LPLNEVYNNLGIALLRLDRPGAVQYFEKAAQSDPSDADYHFNLGYAYWKRGSFADALPLLQKALQRPDPPPAWRFLYLQCLQKTEQGEEAAAQAQLLQQETPEWSRAPSPQSLQNLERPKNNYDGVSFRQLLMLSRIQTELTHAKLALPDHVALHYQQALDFLEEGLDR